MSLSVKKFIISLLKAFIFILLFASIYCYTRDVFCPTDKYTALASIDKQPNNTYDIILAGPSHMQYAIQPAQLFGEHGIVSCNASSIAQSIPTTYYVVKDMVERHDPELVVVDIFNLFYPEAYFTPTRFHQAIDNFNFSINKAEAINDLVDEGKEEFFLNYLLYHGQWKYLQKADYKPDTMVDEAYQLLEGNTVFSEGFVPVEPSEIAEIPEVPLDYLKRIVDLCKETDTPLLLTVIPYRADIDNNSCSAILQQQMFNTVEQLAKEWDVDYLNGLHYLEEMQFDFETDMVEWSHLNASGAKKVTEFYGKYFVEHYSLPDHSQNKKYADWYLDYNEYLEASERLIISQQQN